MHEVTTPMPNYQPQIFNGVSLRYIWTIVIQKYTAGGSILPVGYYQVDAATGELVPAWIIA
jgi:hypothetical protein